jgi:ABC-type oligopeptide transport system ATPase subunit
LRNDKHYIKKAVTKPNLKMAKLQLSAYLGKIVEMAEADELYLNPQSDYTKKLIAAIPKTMV